MNCYHHFTIEECACLRKYYVEGKSYREIARLLGRNISSVSRELRRNYSHMYDIPTIPTPLTKNIYFVVPFVIVVCLETRSLLNILRKNYKQRGRLSK